MRLKFWILKTEPSTYSVEDLKRDKKTRWDGVRNYQARNNLRLMKKGDLAVIYHSGDIKAAVGLATIASGSYKDPTSAEDWSAIDLKFSDIFSTPVTLKQMKADPILKNMTLVKNSRLSVSPLETHQFGILKSLTQL